jgi:hypothetical protein
MKKLLLGLTFLTALTACPAQRCGRLQRQHRDPLECHNLGRGDDDCWHWNRDK